MATLLVLNGPNLNLLGTREPKHYGRDTLADIQARLEALATAAGHRLDFFQSNAEHALVERIHRAWLAGRGEAGPDTRPDAHPATGADEAADFILINPAAFTHTSVAIRDALAGVGIPFIEVHLSNVHAREPFRRHSYLSDIAVGVISGLGAHGYELALLAAMRRLESQPSP